MQHLTDYIRGECSVDDVNNKLSIIAQDMENFINFAYHGGANFDSEFWTTTVKKTSNKLDNDPRWQSTVQEIRSCLNNGKIVQEKSIAQWYIRHWLNWDKHLEYNLFADWS